MNPKNHNNEYARAISDVFDNCPKAVLAAIAVSALTCGGDRLEEARKEVLREWAILHANRIVPQSPPGKYRAEVKAALGDLASS